MKTPEIDEDGYPTEETLQAISQWPHPFTGLIDFMHPIFHHYGRIWRDDGLIKVATGGWSGCESAIGALEQNHMFWSMHWESSHRGGLFTFRWTEPQ